MAQTLVDQISAYEENYFNISALVEEAQQRSEALLQVELMKKNQLEVWMCDVSVYILICMYVTMYVCTDT